MLTIVDLEQSSSGSPLKLINVRAGPTVSLLVVVGVVSIEHSALHSALYSSETGSQVTDILKTENESLLGAPGELTEHNNYRVSRQLRPGLTSTNLSPCRQLPAVTP